MERFSLRIIFYTIGVINFVILPISSVDVFFSMILFITLSLQCLLPKNHLRFLIKLSFYLLCFFYPPLAWSLPAVSLTSDSVFEITLVFSVLLMPNITQPFFIILLSFCAYIASFYLEKTLLLSSQLIQSHDKHRQYELTIISSNEALAEKQEQELHVATLNERNRIARDIHDNVGHLLSSAIIQIGALKAINKDPMLSTQYSTLKATLDEGMSSIRTSVHNLYDESLVLQSEIETLLKKLPITDIHYRYDFESDPSNIIKATFLLILKESLNNIVKHSNASQVEIRLTESSNHYYCIIHDNGTFFEKNTRQGLGLISMAQRVQSLSGIFNTQMNAGFRVYTCIPKETL